MQVSRAVSSVAMAFCCCFSARGYQALAGADVEGWDEGEDELVVFARP